ncbi:hypothetical protein HanPSC8_Chr04g0186311 [Helianthus annuus]|nr:hypothetical protein HanPSC8_Chr04g0186311 [Helianthus annuus]
MNMINWNVKRAHRFPRMKITCKNLICSCFGYQISNKFSCNRHPKETQHFQYEILK